MGSLARALVDYFTAEGLALPTDQAERLAPGRRQRCLEAVPVPLRPAAPRFCEHMLAAPQRARRAGTRPRTDHTIETALAIVRDLALFLADRRGKQDWALTDVHDIEAFLATVPKSRKRRLIVLRQFFRFARARKIVLADPTRGLAAAAPPSGPSGASSPAGCTRYSAGRPRPHGRRPPGRPRPSRGGRHDRGRPPT
jgi:Phage integrase, N-terminal SAM-like domain